MAVNPKQAAKRAFVTILLALATTYGLLLQITRDSDDAAVLKAFRQVAVKRINISRRGRSTS